MGHQIDEGMALAIDGEIFEDAYVATLNPESEIYLRPEIGGGRISLTSLPPRFGGTET